MKILLLLLSLMLVPAAWAAGDLDDGMSSDEAINDDLQTSTNVAFIKAKAKASAKKSKQSEQSGQSGSPDKSAKSGLSGKNSQVREPCGTGNIVIAAGATVKEVINVSVNKGTNVNCVTD